MGEAKRRKDAVGALDELLGLVSQSMAKLAMACSEHLGADCFSHAQLTQAVLAKRGVQARMVIGFAGWRMGPAQTDLVTHALTDGLMVKPGQVGFPYHVWLEIFEPKAGEVFVLDFTTYQLKAKARDLDEFDGGSTQVDWCPPYLLRAKSSCVGLGDLDGSVPIGSAYYEERADVAALVMGMAHPIDQSDLASLEMIMAAPHANIFGPSSGAQRMVGG